MKKVFSLGLLIAAMVLVTFSSCKPANTVKNVTKVRLSEQTKTIKVDEEFTLKATITPADAANKDVTWSSDKPTIASVDNNGKVKGLAIGDATITVTTADGNKTASCKVTVIDKNQATETDLYLFGYLGDLEVEGKYFYTIILTDKGMVNGNNVKDGPCYQITFCSDAPKAPDNKDYSPKMGTYKMGQPKQLEPMFIVRHDKFTFAGKFANNKITVESPFVEGELVVEANKITFKGKDANDAEYDLIFDGTYTVEDASPKPFGDEPEEKTTITKEWKSGQIKMGKVEGNKKPFLLSTDRDSESMATFVLFWEKADATKLDGTYNISDSEEPKTVVKSKGSINSSVYYSFYSKLTDNGYVDKPYYFFDHGTVTVTAGKIEMHVTSHFGSTLNLTYSGDMTPKANTAPQKARVCMSPLKKLRMETPRLR